MKRSMSTTLKLVPAPDGINRKPQQGRSKASLERMLAATEKLMLERGSEEFTLQDVSAEGRVSIGSIYLRFKGKDELVRAVIFDHLERLDAEEEAMVAAIRKECTSLRTFIPGYVDRFAEVLKAHAPLLRLTMLRAEHDSLVSEPGKRSAYHSLGLAMAAMLEHPGEIVGPTKELKASTAYHIIYATIARQLSLGSTGESAHDYDWSLLKRELGRMCLSYLTHAD
jgi:AcrR family transcriptional regulator